MLIVPHVVYTPPATDLYDSHVTSRRDFSEGFEVGDDLGADLVATRLHHPLLKGLVRVRTSLILFCFQPWILPRKAADGSIVVHPEEEASTPQVGECHEDLRERAVVNYIALKVHARVLAVCNQLQKLCLRHFVALESVLAPPALERVLATFEQLFHKLSHSLSIDRTHVFRCNLRVPFFRFSRCAET